jgi:hypothetical protein
VKPEHSNDPMVTPQLDAYGKLAHAIALFVFESMDSKCLPPINELNLQPPFFYTYSQSDLETSADVLWKLRILKSLYSDNRFGVFFKFDCDLANVPTVAIRNVASGPTLERLLWGFIDLRSEYSRMHLDRTTLFFLNGVPIFSIREEERGLLKALEELGYLRAISTGYSSSAKLETLMVCISRTD